MVTSIVPITKFVKIKSREQTNRTFGGDVYIIRSQRLNLLADAPRKTKFNLRVAWAIKMYELPGIKVYNRIIIQNSMGLNILKSCDHAIDLIRCVIGYY